MRLKCLLWVAVFLWAFAAYANVEVSVSQPRLQVGDFRTLVFELNNSDEVQVTGKIYIDSKYPDNRWIRDVTLGPRERTLVRVVMPQDIVSNLADLSLTVGSRVVWQHQNWQLSGSRQKTDILFSSDLAQQSVRTVFGKNNDNLDYTSFNPAEISENAQDYFGVDKIVFSVKAFGSLTPAQHQTLKTYAAAGGALIVLDPAVAKSQVTDTGLGIIVLSPVDPVPEEKLYWLGSYSFPQAKQWTFDFSIPARKLDIRTVFVILLIVSLLIGPGVYFYCSYRKKLVHVVWLIPVLSVIYALALIGYIGWSEGWKSIGERQNRIFLDIPGKRAYGFTVYGFFSSVLPPGNLLVAPGANIDFGNSHFGGYGREFIQVEDTGQSQIWSNCLRSRNKNYVYAYYQYPAVLPDYFEFKRLDADRIELVSNYPATLTNFTLVDENNMVYAAPEVLTGDKTVLRKFRTAHCARRFTLNVVTGSEDFRLCFRAQAAGQVFPPGIFIKTDHLTESTVITGRIGGIQ